MTSPVQLKYRFFKEINYTPHDAQKLLHNSTARFRVMKCGRRFGKTMSMAAEASFKMLKPDSRQWIVAPNYILTEKTFREVNHIWLKYFPDLVERSSPGNYYLKLTNGAEIIGKSADNPPSLLGEGLNELWVDEGALVKQEVWEMYLRATLSDKQGNATFASTPRPTPWFREIWSKGQDRGQAVYESWTFPTSANPFIPAHEIAEAKLTLPDRIFRQEYLAEDIDLEGAVFRSWRQCINHALVTGDDPKIYRAPMPSAKYVVGVDLAKYEDFTVISVLNLKTMQIEFFDRFNMIDWPLQKQRIYDVAKYYYDCKVIIDANSIGDPICDDLKKAGINVQPFKITHQSKEVLIHRLAVAIENKEIMYPNIPELCNELNLFQYKKTPAGNLKMEAPQGYHDDCVISLAMAVQGIEKNNDGFFIGGF